MKCVISLNFSGSSWATSVFPGASAQTLKIANKAWCEYLLDFCFVSSIKDVRILVDDAGDKVEDYFSDGMKWGLSISYGFSREGDGTDEIILKNRDFVSGNQLLLISGPVFINYSAKAPKSVFFQKTGRELRSKDGLGRLLLLDISSDGKVLEPPSLFSQEEAALEIMTISSVKDYYDANMMVIREKRANFVLPGYSNEDGVYLGQNVSTNRTARLEKPLMLGDNVELGALCVLGPSAIIGSNVIIDDSSVIENSIVCDGTYVGRDLDISGKIVSQSSLIDPESGEKFVLADKFILSGEAISEFMLKLKKLRSFIAALVLVVAICPFYLIFIIFSKIFGILAPVEKTYIASDRKSRAKTTFFKDPDSFASRLFFRLSLDKFPLLLEVLKGNIFVAGNSLADSDEAGEKSLENLPIYLPGVFTYAETVSEFGAIPPEERMIHDMYYSHRPSLLLDLKIVLTVFFSRLFGRFYPHSA